MIKDRVQKWRRPSAKRSAKRRLARQFSQIDDHTLRDIGLARTEVENDFYFKNGQIERKIS